MGGASNRTRNEMQYHERFGYVFCADRFWPSYIREFHCYQQTQLENCSAICDAFLKQRSSLVQCVQRNLTNINCNFLHHALLRSPPLSTKLFSLQQISDGIIVGQFEKSGKSNIWHWLATAGQSLDLENLGKKLIVSVLYDSIFHYSVWLF